MLAKFRIESRTLGYDIEIPDDLPTDEEILRAAIDAWRAQQGWGRWQGPLTMRPRQGDLITGRSVTNEMSVQLNIGGPW